MKLRGTFVLNRFNKTLPISLVGTLITCGMISVNVLLGGIFLGENGAAAINAANPIALLGSFIALLFSTGTSIIFGESMGRFDKDSADRIFNTGFFCALLVGILYIGFTLAIEDAFFRFYALAPEVEAMAREYYPWMSVSMGMSPIFSLMYFMDYVDGDNTLPLVAVIYQIIIKIGGVILLIPVLGMKAFGIMALVEILGAVLIQFLHLFRKNNSLHFMLKFEPKKIVDILKYSLMDSSAYLYNAVFFAFLNKFIVMRFGSETLIYSAVLYFVMEISYCIDSIGVSMEPFLNVYHGQNSISGVKNILKIGMSIAVLLGIIAALIMYSMAGRITKSMGVTDPVTFEVCTGGVRVFAITWIINSIHFCLSSYYNNMGRVGVALFDAFQKSIVCEILFVLVFTLTMGIDGLFWGIVTGDVVSLVLLILVVLKKYGRQTFPHTLSYPDEIKGEQMFEYTVEEDSVLRLKNEVEAYLKANGFEGSPVMTVMLILEELSLITKRNNGDRKSPVKAECNVQFSEDITLILSDDGKLMDMTLADSRIKSLGEYVVQRIMNQKTSVRKNLVTTGCNRCAFVIPGKEKGI